MMDVGDAIVLAFRGTHNIQDWLKDIDIKQVPLATPCDPESNFGARVTTSKIRVHEGFLTDVDSLLPKIISRLNGNTKPLIITGHSLGGAMASLAAFAFSKSGFAQREISSIFSTRGG